MLSPESKNLLKKQGYRVVGNHSAVKTCGWTKNMIRGRGGCYKLKFYGIMSNQCLQMTSSMSCANRCTFCWRDYKAPVSKEWKWAVDEPEFIVEESIKEHHKLLLGFKGETNPNPDKTPYENSKQIKHVALSLTGEPITYPKINELVNSFHKKGISTFIVTNAQYPEAIKNLKHITQLYISLDAPNPKLLKSVDIPLFKDYWKRLEKSLEYMKEKKQRTCIRLTMIKGINMVEPELYAEMIQKAMPDFIEVKSYMHVGASQQRLKRSNMPTHSEVVEFSKQLQKFLPDYEIVSEHKPSCVTMLANKKLKINGVWKTWIDFEKFFELVKKKKIFTSLEYSKETPSSSLIRD
ncbi:4-demethylwyosine synthase TYW1 [Candidatus Pacearchaeota archaeon]|nr:4-demethylwyosine synthase TYW1 [Candidatus Pacearchaeota archaeon]